MVRDVKACDECVKSNQEEPSKLTNNTDEATTINSSDFQFTSQIIHFKHEEPHLA